jgi:NAD(P)-dependent dehydrogenase (short-subunit alcohol dehydrogenase family)
VSSLFDLSGKVALITGGAQGLGRLIAHGMLDAGARVYITSRRAEQCEQAARELSVDGHCIGIQADVATTAGVVALSTELKTRESRLDILVNNAGKTWGAPLESFPDQAWSRVMSVNVQGPFTLIKELLPLLKAAASAADPARIINIGSIAGTVVEPLQAYSYAASKAAIHHLSRVLAAELAPQHINVNVLVPGYFPTQMTAHVHADEAEQRRLTARIPLGRLGNGDDIAGGCIFLASRAGAYVTGSEICMDGGMSGCR